jgi:hypothetical protein
MIVSRARTFTEVLGRGDFSCNLNESPLAKTNQKQKNDPKYPL